MENPKGEPSRILLKDLEKEYYRLQFLVEQQGIHLQREMEVSMKAGEIVGKLYDAFVVQYDADDPQSLRYLNIYYVCAWCSVSMLRMRASSADGICFMIISPSSTLASCEWAWCSFSRYSTRLPRLRLERDFTHHLRWCVRKHPQPRDSSFGRYALYLDREYPQGYRPSLL